MFYYLSKSSIETKWCEMLIFSASGMLFCCLYVQSWACFVAKVPPRTDKHSGIELQFLLFICTYLCMQSGGVFYPLFLMSCHFWVTQLSTDYCIAETSQIAIAEVLNTMSLDIKYCIFASGEGHFFVGATDTIILQQTDLNVLQFS